MYPQHIQEAAAAIGRTLTESDTPLYGSGLRLPDRRAVIELVKEVRRLLFPAYFGDPALMSLAPENYAALLLERICEKLTEQLKLALPEDQVGRAEEIAREFARRLPQVQKLLLEDLDATFESDPAAASREEIIFAYPGLFAIFVYRIAHLLYCQRVPMIPRIMSEYAHSRTGIDIHPGASIGPHFFIDHGTGIVVGETTIIGDHVKLYQGVTLGALSPRHGHAVTGKRHPTLGNNVLIGAGTKVLGPVYIGDNARIGAGSVVLKNLPANCTAVGVPAEVVRINNKAINPADDLDQQDLPDIMAQRLIDLDRRIGQLEKAAQGDIPPTAQQVAARQRHR